MIAAGSSLLADRPCLVESERRSSMIAAGSSLLAGRPCLVESQRRVDDRGGGTTHSPARQVEKRSRRRRGRGGSRRRASMTAAQLHVPHTLRRAGWRSIAVARVDGRGEASRFADSGTGSIRTVQRITGYGIMPPSQPAVRSYLGWPTRFLRTGSGAGKVRQMYGRIPAASTAPGSFSRRERAVLLDSLAASTYKTRPFCVPCAGPRPSGKTAV
jgi:hypothetical protein